MDSTIRRRLVFLLLAAVVLRALFCGLVVGFGRAPIGDEVDYHALATHLSKGAGFSLVEGQPTAARPPLYPAFLGLIYKVTGPSLAVARWLQVILGTVVVWLAFLAAGRYFSERTAFLAAALCAVNPFLIFASAYVLTENLYIVLLLLFLLLLPEARQAPWKRLSAASLILGVAVAARPTALGIVVWAALILLLFGPGLLRSRVARAALVVLLAMLPLLPWAARNSQRFDRWIFFTTHGGITFYQGNNAKVLEIPHYHGAVAPLEALPRFDEISRLPSSQMDGEAWRLGMEFLRTHKRQIPELLWWKFARFWRFQSDVGLSGVKSGWWWDKGSVLGRLATTFDAGFAYAIVVIPLFVLGVVLTGRSWNRLLFPYGLVLAHTLVALVFFGSLRMRIPIEPVIAVFAAEAMVRVWSRLRKGREPAPVGDRG